MAVRIVGYEVATPGTPGRAGTESGTTSPPLDPAPGEAAVAPSADGDHATPVVDEAAVWEETLDLLTPRPSPEDDLLTLQDDDPPPEETADAPWSAPPPETPPEAIAAVATDTLDDAAPMAADGASGDDHARAASPLPPPATASEPVGREVLNGNAPHPAKRSAPSSRPRAAASDGRLAAVVDRMQRPIGRTVLVGHVAAVVVGVMVIGVFLGCLIGWMSGNEQPKGLMGVVANPDLSAPLTRCGAAAEGAPCVAYVMNAKRRDLSADDMLPTVSSLTGISEYRLREDNLGYRMTLIRPGYFGQFIIRP